MIGYGETPPHARWPGDARIAVQFVVNYEEGGENNILHGDALTMRTRDGTPIAFAEWGYVGKGKFQRRDFRLDVLTGSSNFSAEGSLFGKHEIFTPIKTYPPMTVRELAATDCDKNQEEAS